MSSDDTQLEDTPPASGSPDFVVRAGERIGKYTLVRELGRGGMGVVWAAHDPDLERDVAIKLLRGTGAGPAEKARFLREARAMARLKHPNVLTVYEVGTHAAHEYIAMELVEGANLDEWLRTTPSQDAVWEAVVGAGQGLAAAHEAGLVHRDFKPHNVLVRRDGRVLVTDFGLVRTIADDAVDEPIAAVASGLDATVPIANASASGEKLTHTGAVMGTPAYMAPEQFAGSLSDPRSDQYAFCITIWQALAGARPYEGTTLEELQRRASEGIGDVDAPFSDEVRSVLARGLAPRPADRHATIKALLDALAHARRAPGRRRIALVTSIGACVLVAVAIVVWQTRPRPGWQPNIQSIEPAYDENSESPAISPDGTTIVFGAGRGRDPEWQVYTQPISGGEARVLIPENCGWSTRWTPDGSAVILACGHAATPKAERSIILLPIAGGPPQPLGPGVVAEPCADRLLVVVETAGRTQVVSRAADGRDTVLFERPVQQLRCDRSGQLIAYVQEPGADDAEREVWLVERGAHRLLLRGRVADMTFTPGGKSLLIAQTFRGENDLFELVLANGALHRLTTGATARSVDVSSDGSTVLFNKDTTGYPLIEQTATTKRQVTHAIEMLRRPVVTPDGKRVVVERDQEGGSSIVVVTLDSGVEREVARGRAPFVSHDGTRILYAASDDRLRLDQVPIDGGATATVATLPAPIVDGVDAPDGIHLELATAQPSSTTHGWLIRGDALHDEGVDGLVFPSPSGWRAVRSKRDGKTILSLVAPGKPLQDVSFEREINGRPTWITAQEIGFCDVASCDRVDVMTGTTLETTPNTFDARRPSAVSPDGKRWYTAYAVGQVTRQKIVNFAARPWKP